jgi:hypothetical protein
VVVEDADRLAAAPNRPSRCSVSPTEARSARAAGDTSVALRDGCAEIVDAMGGPSEATPTRMPGLPVAKPDSLTDSLRTPSSSSDSPVDVASPRRRKNAPRAGLGTFAEASTVSTPFSTLEIRTRLVPPIRR